MSNEQTKKCANKVNVGTAERVLSTLFGAKLIASGLSRDTSTFGLLKAGIGGLLTYRGVSGHCALYDRVGAKRPAPALSHPLSREIRVIESVTIGSTPDELYSFWRDMRNLPQIVPQIQSVQVIDPRHSKWIIDESSCPPVCWDALITEDEPNTFIEWVALDNDKVQHRGGVEFAPAIGNRGTVVRVDLKYHPLGGAVGAMVAKLMHRGPSQEIRNQLRRFKQFIETGEIANSAGPSARATNRNPLKRVRKPEVDSRAAANARVDETSMESFPASDPPALSGSGIQPEAPSVL